MKWFKHISDLPRDEGVSRYLDAAGRDRVTAYGFLIFLLEAIASRMLVQEGDLICSATYSIPQWGRITHSHPNRVRKYLGMCEVIGWVLVEYEGGMCKVSAPKMVQWRDDTTRKSGMTPDQVGQKREEKKRTEKRESIQEGSLSDCLTAESQGRRAPPDFDVSKVLQEWAAANYPSVPIEKETAKFKRWEFPTPRSDWDAAWKTWIQQATEYQENRNGSADKLSRRDQLLALGKELGLGKQPDETEVQYCDRVDQFNQHRIETLNS